MSDPGSSFFKDSIEALFKPESFFAAMPKSGGIAGPVQKSLFHGILAAVINLVLSFFIGYQFTPVTGGLVGPGGPLVYSFWVAAWSVILALIMRDLGGVVVWLLSAVCGGLKDFEASLRISSNILVFFPLSSFLLITSRIPRFGAYLFPAIAALLFIWSMWLVYSALVHALGAKQLAARIVCITIAFIPVIFLVRSFF